MRFDAGKKLYSEFLNDVQVMHLTLLILIARFHGGSRDYTSGRGRGFGWSVCILLFQINTKR